MTYAHAQFEVDTFNCLGADAVFKKIHCLTFDLDHGAKVTLNAAQYPLHHVTHAATKFEVATSNYLGGDNYKKRDGRTDAQTDGRTDRRLTDRLWFEIRYAIFF